MEGVFFNIKDYGVAGNGKDKDPGLIQKAVETVQKAGGGTLYFPAGQYFSGPLVIGSNMTIFLDAGAFLKFSDDFSLYPPAKSRWEGVECYTFAPLMLFIDAQNVSLTGRGTIDGCGKTWWDAIRKKRADKQSGPVTKEEKELARLNPGFAAAGSGGGGRETQFLRPPLVQFWNCENVKIEGTTHQNSPFWNTHLVYCNNVSIENVTFRNPEDGPNTDGCDIDSCTCVRFMGCHFDVGDDCLVIKSGIDADGRRVGRPTEDVTITNCTMNHGHGGVVMGSEMAGGIRRISISNCVMKGTDRGIRIKTRRGRGGVVENIRVSNVIMDEVLCPVAINLYYRCGSRKEDTELFTSEKRPVTEITPAVRDIHISGLTANGSRAACGFFYGLPEMPIENLTISDSHFTTNTDPEVPGGEPDMIWDLPTITKQGFLGKHLKNVRFSQVVVETGDGNGLDLKDCDGITFDGLELKKRGE
ncbi:MAG: glycoside hydrolase family 28 protein [Spirochaetaceae bacterium]|nr:MAG: glycoside hydrolase family 28 protein [Spirochaetaceae bacterium]